MSHGVSGPHAAGPLVDIIARMDPLQVALRSGSRLKEIAFEPDGRSLKYFTPIGASRQNT